MGAVLKALATPVPGTLTHGRVAALLDDGTVEVVSDDGGTLIARLATSGLPVHADDAVVVAVDARGNAFVIGAVIPARTDLRTADGVVAEVRPTESGEVLSVRDAGGALLFEHRAHSGQSVVHAPHGDLVFSAAQGRIEFAARDEVKIRSERVVDLEAGKSLRASAPSVETRARKASIVAEALTLQARSLVSTVDRVREVVGVLETTAQRIVERARNTYREAEELSHTKAGRLRMVVKDTFSLLGKRAVVRAEQDVRVDGEKIYLG